MQTAVKESLSDVIKQVLYKKRNSKDKELFLASVKDLKPASCKVKVGWHSGNAIDFACYFEKNGESEIFTEMEKGIENPEEIKHFIYGLNPKVFQFYPEMTFDELFPNQLFISFKLKRDGKIKG